MATEVQQTAETLRKFALGLPGTTEEFPWGELVIKVNKKIFVFFGLIDDPKPGLFLGVKLPQSADDVLNLPFARPTGYGLGNHGWVQFRFPPYETPPANLLQRWIMESYRAVAPKKLIAQLAKETLRK
jgi:predicted DNA-binding protein (MmcQ/YjbR family)